MAIVSPNGPVSNKGEIKQILNFLKEVLPWYVVRAIDLLLHPCCLTPATFEFVCLGGGAYDIIVTLDTAITYPSLSVKFDLSGIMAEDGIISNGGKTITFEDVDLTPGSVNATLTFLYPTSGNADISTLIGTFKRVEYTITVPTC